MAGTLALAGLSSVVTGIAGWSLEAAEVFGGLLAFVAAVGYFRGSS